MAEEGQGGPLPSSGPFSTQPRLAFRSASLLLSSPSLPSFGDAPLPVEQDLGSQHRMCGPGQGAPTPASPAPCSTHQPRGSKGPHFLHLEGGHAPKRPTPSLILQISAKTSPAGRSLLPPPQRADGTRPIIIRAEVEGRAGRAP